MRDAADRGVILTKAFIPGVLGVSEFFGDVKVPDVSGLVAFSTLSDVVDLTAGWTFRIWLQASDDDGLTWYDLPYDLSLADAGATAVDQTSDRGKRNLLNAGSFPVKSVTVYRRTGAHRLRVGAFLDGTAIPFGTPYAVFTVEGAWK